MECSDAEYLDRRMLELYDAKAFMTGAARVPYLRLCWITFKLVLLFLLLDATDTVVLYQNY